MAPPKYFERDSPGSPGKPQEQALERLREILFLGLVIGGTLALYVPHLGNSFVHWDFVAYRRILQTTAYWDTIINLFTDLKGRIVAGYYAPLGSISLMLDKMLVGSLVPVPRFTLLINLLLHCLNGILVYWLMRHLSADPVIAILTTTIFLIHPIQVSSILWFAQRKGVLSCFFYLAAFLAYLRFANARSWCAYIGALVLFLAALLTKPTVVVFPLAILVTQTISFWSEDREWCSWKHQGRNSQEICSDRADRDGGSRKVWLWFRNTFVWMLPFFVLAVAFGVIIMESERVSMVTPTRDIPMLHRPVIAATAVWFYVSKILIPLDFSPLYPRWEVDLCAPVWWLPLLALGGAAFIVFYYRRDIGALGLWCFLNMLIPLSTSTALFKFGYLRLSFVADHFFYLSMVAGAAGMALMVRQLTKVNRNWLRSLATAGFVAYLLVLGFHTWSYADAWQNSLSLWSHNLRHNPGSHVSYTYLGHALMEAERPNEAAECFQRTITLKQAFIEDRKTRAWALKITGDERRAEEEWAKASEVRDTLPVAYHNLGNALLSAGRALEAKSSYQQALELKPTLVGAVTNLGVSHIHLKEYAEAARHLERAIALSPRSFEAHYNLGYAYHMLGKKELAEKHFHIARTIRPDYPPPELPPDLPSASPDNQ